MSGFEVTRERLPSGAVHVALRGELDLAHAYAFDEELRRVEEGAPPCIVVDLRELSFVDSAGVSRLMSARSVRGAPGGGWCSCAAGARSSDCSRCAVEESFEIVSDVPAPLREPPTPSR